MSKKVDVKSLKSGMKTVDDIITKHGQIIAPKDTVINDSLIARLRFYGITQVEIEEDLPQATPQPTVTQEVEAPAPAPAKPVKPVMPDPPLAEVDTTSYTQKLKRSPVFQKFQVDFANVLTALQNTYDRIVENDVEGLDLNILLDEATTLYSSKTTIQLFDIIHGMKGSDDSIYIHAINVGLISRCIAKWLRMTKREMDSVMLAGLLYDIGKVQIPDAVLNKEGKLTEDEFSMIRQHPAEGMMLLKRVPGIDSHILNAALQHHERYDGSGYPKGLQTDEIDDYASIIAIADVYEAMTAVRSHREPLCAFQVIEAFENDGLQKYKPKIILTFLERVAATYQNSRVLLNDGSSCRVIYINPGKLSRPVVRLDDRSVIDLSRTPGKYIKAII